jgi:hypothetical protein
VIAVQTSLAPSQQTSSPKSSSSNIAIIAGGAVGGFLFLVGVVAAIWFILCVLVTHFRTDKIAYLDTLLVKSVAKPMHWQIGRMKTLCSLTQ